MIIKNGWSSYIGISFVICCVMAAYIYKGNYFGIQPKSLSIEQIKDMPKDLSGVVLDGHIPHILVIKIRDNEFSYFYDKNQTNDPRLNVVVNTLIKIISADLGRNQFRRIPDGDYLITLADSLNDKLPWPIMTFASSHDLVAENYVVLMPDFEALQGYEALFHNVDAASQKYPWSAKLAKIFGHGNEPSLDDPVAHKYLLSIDGNSCPYSCMAWALYSNSVLFKHASDKVQWYYDKLQAGVHYLPINSDYSNLQTQFEWAESNPEQAQAIANNGHQLAKELFNRRSITDATVEAFVKYKQITDSKLTPEPV